MPFKDPEARKKHGREYKRRKAAWAREHGLCPQCCKREPVEGYTDCEFCIIKRKKSRNNHTAKYKKKYREDGRCISCGRPLLESGVDRCMICRNKRGGIGWS